MRYGLVTRRNAIDAREIKGYSLIPGYKYNEKSLPGIDAFCQRFNNEEELKTFLLDAGLLKNSEWDNKIVIAAYDERYSRPRSYIVPSFKYEMPFFNFDYLLNYYLNNVLDLNLVEKFKKRFQSSRDVDYRFFRPYYELMCTGTLDDNSRKRLADIMKNIIQKFVFYSPSNSKERKINYFRLRVLAKMASGHASEKGTRRMEETEEYIKTPITDEALRSELYQRYQDLEDNPTKEESEAILSRVKEIEDYFNAVKELSANAVRQRRLTKKERPELYN